MATALICDHVHCYPDSGCALGNELHECKHLRRSAAERSTPVEPLTGDGLPWTGSALGTDDLAWMAQRQRPWLCAPVGAHNAGKTTYLAALYIGICRGLLPAEHQFVGSFTLGGWEKLAAHLRHAPDGFGPGFPPHTPVTEARKPGWLHLGLRDARNGLKDILLADAPGEWFSRWAIRPDDDQATGARWVVAHADGFLFFVDSLGLVGPDRRAMAENTELLAQRLAATLQGRPVAIVWAKSDQEVAPALREDVKAALARAFPGAPMFSTSVHDTPPGEATRPFWRPLEWHLLRESVPGPLALSPTVDPTDSFLSFRG